MRRWALAFLGTLLFVLPVSGAENGWRIEAGRGVGPLHLGMTEDEAVRVLGEPTKRITIPFHALSYSRVELIFAQARGEAFALIWIRIKDRAARTLEGVGVGSSLSEVLRYYGDKVDNTDSTSQGSSSCLSVGLISPKPSHYRSVVLSLDYRQRGMEFNFTDITEGAVFTPKVADIIITRPSSCSG
jgi:hypothetical protein